jgi:hypothetical protein
MIDPCSYSTITMLSSSTSSSKQRRRRIKGQVKSTKQKCGSTNRRMMCGTTAESQGMRLSVTSSYIKHNGCLLSLHSCDTVLVGGWTDEAKTEWLQLAATPKLELQRMRLSVTSSGMKHDCCLLSQLSCDTAVISVDMGVKGEVAAAMDMAFSTEDANLATYIYTILCIFKNRT